MSTSPDTATISPSEGWHCSHLYYRFDRKALRELSTDQLRTGREQFIATLTPNSESAGSDQSQSRSEHITAQTDAPARVQVSITSGHKADFGLMVMDANPLVIDTVHQRLLASPLGRALVPTYSFVSVTEVSEYVPTVEAYGRRLVEEGEQLDSPGYKAKLKAYENREAMMRRQRLTPDLPPWPNTCFYPMNKKRKVGENWFLLPFDERNKLMAEHGRTGMTFGGKVTQLITVALGFDDWEWGVTLWARSPEFLKEIVYRMRFDEASARYAEFGPFYVGYVTTPAELLKHCRIGEGD
jgi:peroxiredoxin